MSVNSKMTAIADEIRELSGTEDAMGLDAMVEHIGSANTEVSSQADLLAQIQSALQGKAGGSSGGSSDGGPSVELCTVDMTFDDINMSGTGVTRIIYCTAENSAIKTKVAVIKTDFSYTESGSVTGNLMGWYTGSISCIVGTGIYLFDENMHSPTFVTSNNITANGAVDEYGTVFEAVVNSGPTGSITA